MTMTVEQVSVWARVIGLLLAGWKVRHWLRAFVASRRMRTFYEGQTPEKQKEIEASWKEGSLNGAYTKPLPTRLAILYFLIAFSLLAALVYFTYVNPLGSGRHR